MMTGLSQVAHAFRSSAFPAVTVPELIESPILAKARDALRLDASQLFEIADRGRYLEWPGHEETIILPRLLAVAESIVGMPLAPMLTRWSCLEHRSYGLVRDDDLRQPADAWIEVLLDLSEAPTGAAEVIYNRPEGAIVIPQLPGHLTIVGRDTSTRRYERYLNHRVRGARVHRLTLALVAQSE